MKTAFIATSYKHRDAMADVLQIISHQLFAYGYTPFIFVQVYNFAPDETQIMMDTSFKHIRECDLFIAELTHKVVGVGIEAGYASAHNKPIIYIRHERASASTTMTGIATYQVVYHDNNNLSTVFGNILAQF